MAVSDLLSGMIAAVCPSPLTLSEYQLRRLAFATGLTLIMPGERFQPSTLMKAVNDIGPDEIIFRQGESLEIVTIASQSNVTWNAELTPGSSVIRFTPQLVMLHGRTRLHSQLATGLNVSPVTRSIPATVTYLDWQSYLPLGCKREGDWMLESEARLSLSRQVTAVSQQIRFIPDALVNMSVLTERIGNGSQEHFVRGLRTGTLVIIPTTGFRR